MSTIEQLRAAVVDGARRRAVAQIERGLDGGRSGDGACSTTA